MIESDVLVVSEISYQYAIAKGKISTDNENYISVKNSLIDFITNPLLSGEAYIAAKQHMMNYCSLIDYIVFQNNCEMARYDDLNELLYNLDYDEFRGDEILIAKEIAFDDLNRYGALENSYYQEYLNTPIYHPLIKWGAYDNYVYYGQLRSEAENTFNEMCRLINQFDSFVYATSNFFYVQHEWHQVALMTLGELNASVADGTYNIDRSNAALHISYGDQDNDVSSWMNGIYNNKIQSFYTTDASGNRVLNAEAIQVFFSRDPETVSQYEYEAFARLLSCISNDQINDVLACSIDTNGINEISAVFVNCCRAYYTNSLVQQEMVSNENDLNMYIDSVRRSALLYNSSLFVLGNTDLLHSLTSMTIYIGDDMGDNSSLNISVVFNESDETVFTAFSPTDRVGIIRNQIDSQQSTIIGEITGLGIFTNGYSGLLEAANNYWRNRGISEVIMQGAEMAMDEVYSGSGDVVEIGRSICEFWNNYQRTLDYEANQMQMNYIDAFFVTGGMITSSNADNQIIMYGTDMDYTSLRIALESYNRFNCTDISVDELCGSIGMPNGNADRYIEWYFTYHGYRSGEDMVEEYRNDLVSYYRENISSNLPESIEELSVNQLDELIEDYNASLGY